MQMICRECSEDDFHKLLPLFSQLWPDQQVNETAMKEVFTNGLHSKNHYYLCVENDGKIIGFCSLSIKNNLWQQGKLGHVDEIVIAETRRGLGIGTELLTRITQVAKSMGCKRVELDSAHHRTEAHIFYEKNGFKNRALLFSKNLNSQ